MPDWCIDLIPAFFPLIGYLELHYRFRWFPFSRYFRREPEVYADAPFRIGPGKAIPITILVKDADRYPIKLEKVIVNLRSETAEHSEEFELNRECSDHWFDQTFWIESPVKAGTLRISVEIHISGRTGNKIIRNHNVATSPPFDLEVVIDPDPLPGSEDFWWGDLHYHSNYTEDFVEFGASLEASKSAAKACELDFLAISDHSYDLDDEPGSWTETDPELSKWKESGKAIKELNQKDSPILIPAEEVTSRNHRGYNVHTLVFNGDHFIPGSGDGAEVPLKTFSEHSIEEIAKNLAKDKLIIAAHPRVKTAFLEKLLIHRGSWESPDRNIDGVHGFEILNGTFDQSFEDGLKYWIEGLQAGEKRFIYAGNDAHGNFNRFHQISLPMWSTHNHRDQILGQCRTGVLKSDDLSLQNVLDQLKSGHCFITNGPSIRLIVQGEKHTAEMGETLKGQVKLVSLGAKSSELWGKFMGVEIIHGIPGKGEKVIYSEKPDDYSMKIEIKPKTDLDPGYLRAIVVTAKGKKAYTNPVWVEN